MTEPVGRGAGDKSVHSTTPVRKGSLGGREVSVGLSSPGKDNFLTRIGSVLSAVTFGSSSESRSSSPTSGASSPSSSISLGKLDPKKYAFYSSSNESFMSVDDFPSSGTGKGYIERLDRLFPDNKAILTIKFDRKVNVFSHEKPLPTEKNTPK